MTNITSLIARNDPLFLRNAFKGCGRFGIPLVKKQKLSLEKIDLISYSDTRPNDNEGNKCKGVHFFIDDYRFNGVYINPLRSFKKLSQYKFLLTPDYSMYAEMQPWRQIESLAHSRWCGAYWQSQGRIVIPTVSWSTSSSFEYFCDGIEYNSVVAIGMIGCKSNRLGFMRGYNTMLEKLNPSAIICFGKPFEEMQGNLFVVDYQASRKVAR